MWHVLLHKGLREAQLSSQHQRISEHNHYGLPSCGSVFEYSAWSDGDRSVDVCQTAGSALDVVMSYVPK